MAWPQVCRVRNDRQTRVDSDQEFQEKALQNLGKAKNSKNLRQQFSAVKPRNGGLLHQSKFFHYYEIFHYFEG